MGTLIKTDKTYSINKHLHRLFPKIVRTFIISLAVLNKHIQNIFYIFIAHIFANLQ